ncbi:MAG: 1,4-dihydroxy-2-naphthoate octaprenyltransferase [Thermodesulfobacteriota bacterium]
MNIFRNWFLASRPWSFTMSAISVSVGAAMGAIDGDFSWRLYLITMAGIVFLHAASNLNNDYHDVRRGVDTADAPTARYRPHPLMEGRLKPKHVLIESYLLFAAAGLAGLYLAATRGWPILAIGITGVLAGLAYTAPPFNYKYHALGEVSVFLMWGPLMVEGAYFVQRQAFSLNALWVSIPFGVLVALVLLANNIRDIFYDRDKGIQTIPILIGRQNGIRLYIALVVLAYASVLWMALMGPLQLWSLAIFFSLPLAYRLLGQILRKVPLDADARTAQLNTAFGILLVASLVLEHLV